MASVQNVDSAIVSNVDAAFQKARGWTDKEIEEFSLELLTVLRQNNNPSASIRKLRQLYVIVAWTRKDKKLPGQLLSYLLQIITESSQTPHLVLLSTSYLLNELAPRYWQNLRSIQNLDKRNVLHVLPLLLTEGKDLGYWPENLPHLLKWVTIQTPSEAQLLAMTTVISIATSCPSLMTEEFIQKLNSVLGQWLLDTSIESARGRSPADKKNKIPTEIDGSQIRGNFTILCTASFFTQDQLRNIYAFSAIRRWLITNQSNMERAFTSNTSTPTSRSSPTAGSIENSMQSIRRLSNLPAGTSALTPKKNRRDKLLDIILTYCSRLIDQSELKATNSVDTTLQFSCLVEVVTLMNNVCDCDPSSIPALFNKVKRIYKQVLDVNKGRTLLAVIQFFINFGDTVVFDTKDALEFFFAKVLDTRFHNSFLAFDVVMFLIENQEKLCANTEVFTRYFPNILKIFAWFPRTYLVEYVQILPSMISAKTATEMLHTIIDLPCVSAALEAKHMHQQAQVLIASGRTLPTKTAFDFGVVISPTFEPILSFILRCCSGKGDTINKLNTLHDVLEKFSTHPRISVCSQCVPILLNVFFKVIMEKASYEIIHDLFPAIIERSVQLYQIRQYQENVLEVFSAQILILCKQYPRIVVDRQAEILDYISQSKHALNIENELYMHMIWIIGEYSSSQYYIKCTKECVLVYYECIESLSYEVCLNHAGDSKKFTARFVTLLMTCLAKSTQPKNGNSNEFIINRANELVKLLQLPNVASAVLNPALQSESQGIIGKRTSLSLLLQTTQP
ncbi:AP-5 complex subunit zeta-1 [Trichoplax sp. H2]|nr:AP-5 complex subunit zeta-1 [Trichoplax sp. H2]|eukprot:RDD43954.1 AP-5 complex subunit zeta-1 [Trichoplax sp. H2]